MALGVFHGDRHEVGESYRKLFFSFRPLASFGICPAFMLFQRYNTVGLTIDKYWRVNIRAQALFIFAD
jgi:hypothetical protein